MVENGALLAKYHNRSATMTGAIMHDFAANCKNCSLVSCGRNRLIVASWDTMYNIGLKLLTNS